MQKVVWMVVCLVSTAGGACAQSANDAVNAFRDSVGKSQLVLRNFSGEDEVEAKWDGKDFQLAAPRWRTLGILQVNSAKLKGHELRLACTRHVAVVNLRNQLALFEQPTTVEIRVDLGSSDPAEMLPKLKHALFYGSARDALAAIPRDRQLTIPARTAAKPTSFPDGSKPACDCATDDLEKCAADHRRIEGTTPPVLLNPNDPHIGSDGSNPQREGVVGIALKVDEAGRPQDVWVARSAGWGLDEEAAKAVLAYKFRPSMCDAKPQTVYLNVDFASRTVAR